MAVALANLLVLLNVHDLLPPEVSHVKQITTQTKRYQTYKFILIVYLFVVKVELRISIYLGVF